MAKIILSVDFDSKKAVSGIKALDGEIKKLTSSLSNIKLDNSILKQLQELSKYYQTISQITGTITDKVTIKKNAISSVETLRKQYANLVSTLKTLQQQYPSGAFDNLLKGIEQNYNQIKKLSSEYQKTGQLSANQINELRSLSGEYRTLSADIAQARAENEKLWSSQSLSPKIGTNIARLETQYAQLLMQIKNASKYYPKGTFDQLTESVKQSQTAVANLSTEFKNGQTLSSESIKKMNELNSTVSTQRAEFEKTKQSATNYHGTLVDIVGGFLKFQVSAMLVMKPLQAIQNALRSINETLVETESVVVSIQRVLDETVLSGEIENALYDIAQRLGQTFDNVQEIAQNFAKAGLDWQDTLAATEAAVLALNVAELTAEESSEGLIAVMQQFNYEASQLTYVIDVLNKAADKSAVDTQELLTAIQRTGSYAAAANVTLEETVALIAALSEATAASGSMMGNALKSLFAYTSKSSALDVFASLSDEMAHTVELYRIGSASILDVWQGLSEEMQSLTAEQANMLSQWTESSGLETELGSSLSDVYDQMTGVYDTANTYRKNYFIALLNNFDEVSEVMDEISDASGYTAEEQAKYMDTYEAKLNALQSQWEALINDEDGWLGFKKGLLDFASGILSAIDALGGLRTVVIAVGTALSFAFGSKMLGVIVSFAKTVGKAIVALVTNLKGLATGALSAQVALNGILGIAGIVATIFSFVIGRIDAAEQAAEEARQASIDAWDAIKEEATELASLYSQLEKLSAVTDKTVEQEEQYATVTEDIIDLLGYRANALKDLTAGTEEYTDKLKELTKAEIERNYKTSQTATNAAREQLNALDYNDYWGENTYFDPSKRIDLHIEDASEQEQQFIEEIKKAGLSVWGGVKNEIGGSHKVNVYTALSGNPLSDIQRVQDILRWMADNGYATLDIYNQFAGFEETLYEAIYSYLESEAQTQTLAALMNGDGIIDTQAEFDAIVDKVMEASGATEDYREDIESLVKEYSGFSSASESVNESLDDTVKAIEYLSEASIDELVSALEEMRDLESEAEEIEEKRLAITEAQQAVTEAQQEAEEARLEILEKQKAVLEAQKALEDARKNRSVRRFNAATGTYEWVTDEKAVADAEEDLKDAEDAVEKAKQQHAETLEAIKSAEEKVQEVVDAFNEYIEDQAWDSVIEELESGNGTNESIKEILDKWKETAAQEATANTEWYEKIVNAIKENSGVDVTQSASSTGTTKPSTSTTKKGWSSYNDAVKAGFSNIMMPQEWSRRDPKPYGTESYQEYLDKMYDTYVGTYDSGGIANGIGLLAKATAKPETVNNPDLTAKILSPTSNAQFDRFTRNMEILFDKAEVYSAAPPQMQRIAGNTVSTTNNSNTYVNGVTIGADMMEKPFGKVLEMIGLVPNRN